MHKKNSSQIRILGLFLLAVVGGMAVSASAAQAKWLLLRAGVSVSELKLNAAISLKKLLLPGLKAEIHCPGGTAEVTVNLSEEQKTLTSSMKAIFTGCTDLLVGKSCQIGSEGQPNGTIVMTGTGVGGMGAGGEEEYFVNMSSEEFAFVEYRGALCPIDEVDDMLFGNLRIDLLNALENTKLKSARILDKGLFYWAEEAFLHGGENKPLSMSLTEVAGNSWGVHLVGL